MTVRDKDLSSKRNNSSSFSTVITLSMILFGVSVGAGMMYADHKRAQVIDEARDAMALRYPAVQARNEVLTAENEKLTQDLARLATDNIELAKQLLVIQVELRDAHMRAVTDLSDEKKGGDDE